MGKIIYDSRDLGELTNEMLKSIQGAVYATAYKVRDDARNEYRKSKSMYKKPTDKFTNLQGGIMVGKLRGGEIKVHALGDRQDQELWKARFFVGGTVFRQDSKGRFLGYIKENDALTKSVGMNKQTLNNYINNAINGK